MMSDKIKKLLTKDFSYPETDDEDFQNKIYEKREFYYNRVEELKDERHKQDNFYTFIQEGYWQVTPTCAYRIDKKFVEWYSTWIKPVQMELELEYKGLPAKEEKRYESIYGGLIE